MGDHYIPQYYLKGFSQNNGKTIWVYDKQDNRKYSTQVKSTANETGLYDPKWEQYLAKIEGLANPVLDKIRKRERITAADKEALSDYMVVMWKRVPQSRKFLKTRAPTVADKLCEDLSATLSMVASEEPERTEFVEQRKIEIREILDQIGNDPPKEIWLNNIPPETTPRMTAYIKKMTWKFGTFDHGPAFLTCDNPVFVFPSLGIAKPESELVFPVSSHVVLWGTWRTDLREDYVPVSSQEVKEMNRRIASQTLRYLWHLLFFKLNCLMFSEYLGPRYKLFRL